MHLFIYGLVIMQWVLIWNLDEDGSGVYLVDFQKKAIDDVLAKRAADRRQEEQRRSRWEPDSKSNAPDPAEHSPPASTPDEEWWATIEQCWRWHKFCYLLDCCIIICFNDDAYC